MVLVNLMQIIGKNGQGGTGRHYQSKPSQQGLAPGYDVSMIQNQE